MEPQQEANGQEGKKPPHKPSGDDCSRSSSQDVYQITPSSEKRTPDVGQQNSINLFNQDGGTKNKALTEISKSLWDYLLSRETTLTAEYLPSKLNIEADYQSRNVTDCLG